MSANVMPFDFNGKEVRVIEHADGSAWFVAKDVCEVLGVANSRGAVADLDEDEKGVVTTDTLGGPQQVGIISESGLYKLIFKSRKTEAKAFTKWITSEVLPSIRKTGSYSAHPAPEVKPHFSHPLNDAALVMPNLFDALKRMGIEHNAAVISANQAVNKAFGQNVLELTGLTHLLAIEQERVLTPTDMGKLLTPPVGPVMMNKYLVQAGLQYKGADGKWRPTELGKPYARLFDTGKQHASGAPVQQLKWLESTLAYVKDALFL